jgi:hypothetical protein
MRSPAGRGTESPLERGHGKAQTMGHGRQAELLEAGEGPARGVTQQGVHARLLGLGQQFLQPAQRTLPR